MVAFQAQIIWVRGRSLGARRTGTDQVPTEQPAPVAAR
jgi:hypothetical protein